MTTMAAQQVAHFERVRAHLAAQDADVMSAMAPFEAAFTAFHTYTRPKDWLEGLLKAYVGDGFAADFYREVAAFVDADTRRLVHEVLADAGHADFVVEKVRAAIEADPKVAGRLALWSRRLVGEALSQAQRVAADRDSLTSLLTGTVAAPDWTSPPSAGCSRLIENHPPHENLGPAVLIKRSRSRRGGRSPRRCRGRRCGRRDQHLAASLVGQCNTPSPPTAALNAFSTSTAESLVST